MMCDTAYGRVLAQKKKELTEALGRSNKAEKVEWIAKIDLMNPAEADEEAGDDGEEGAA